MRGNRPEPPTDTGDAEDEVRETKASGSKTRLKPWHRRTAKDLGEPTPDECATLEYIQNHLAADGRVVVARQRGLLEGVAMLMFGSSGSDRRCRRFVAL